MKRRKKFNQKGERVWIFGKRESSKLYFAKPCHSYTNVDK
jgi:hypothetical protein